MQPLADSDALHTGVTLPFDLVDSVEVDGVIHCGIVWQIDPVPHGGGGSFAAPEFGRGAGVLPVQCAQASALTNGSWAVAGSGGSTGSGGGHRSLLVVPAVLSAAPDWLWRSDESYSDWMERLEWLHGIFVG